MEMLDYVENRVKRIYASGGQLGHPMLFMQMRKNDEKYIIVENLGHAPIDTVNIIIGTTKPYIYCFVIRSTHVTIKASELRLRNISDEDIDNCGILGIDIIAVSKDGEKHARFFSIDTVNNVLNDMESDTAKVSVNNHLPMEW